MATELKVMVVDDDALIRLTVREVLKDAGIGVVEADGAGQCLEHLRQGFKGVVLMDIMMPGRDGWDTIREIIENGLYKSIIIVMLTAMDVPGSKMEGLQEYVTDYMTKPFTQDELVSYVRNYFIYLEKMGNE
ncbi:MAG TPA: response regulator [Nitrospirae bacterium]|nr:response regulator [Nitrospirota bacterium]